jgi:NAD(P)-dependent dehydrogenase (short-subunit alcohol dehydrogenase family)
MPDTRIAVVTGANRGLGREIARQLAVQGLTVVLTSRDPAKGHLALADFREQGLTADHHALDVRDPFSVSMLRDWLDKRYGRVDVLVNNSGILIDRNATRLAEIELECLRWTMETNLYGALRMTQALLPLMHRHGYGRIVNMSSTLGQLADMRSGTPAYRISKTALNAATRILAAELKDTNIKVNAMCPGWVRTDMGGPQATRSVEEGADTAVWLATLPDEGPSGGFFQDRGPVPW